MYQVAIVGAGPIGLACAIAASKENLSHILIDKGYFLNSVYNFPHNMTFFSTADLLEIGNIPFISPGEKPKKDDALRYYQRLIKFFNINLRLFTGVVDIKKQREKFLLLTNKGEIEASNVIIATGYYDNPNKLNIPGEELPHVVHYYTDPHRYINQKVVIIGGSNSAAINALELLRAGIDVTLVHRGKKLSRRIKYWILPDIENRIKNGEIPAFFETTAVEIKEKSIILNKNGENVEIPGDSILAMTGYHPDFDFLRRIGINVSKETNIPDFNTVTGETNVSGLYLAGSLRAGKDSNKIFIENGHLHGPEIIKSIKSY